LNIYLSLSPAVPSFTESYPPRLLTGPAVLAERALYVYTIHLSTGLYESWWRPQKSDSNTAGRLMEPNAAGVR